MNQSTVPPDIPTTEYWTTEFWPPVLTVHTAQIVYRGFSSTYYIVNVSVTATKYTPSEDRLQSLDQSTSPVHQSSPPVQSISQSSDCRRPSDGVYFVAVTDTFTM